MTRYLCQITIQIIVKSYDGINFWVTLFNTVYLGLVHSMSSIQTQTHRSKNFGLSYGSPNIHKLNFLINFSEIFQLYNSTRKCTGGMINSPPNSTNSKTSLIKFLTFRNESTLQLYAKKYSHIKFFEKFLRNFSTLQLYKQMHRGYD